VCHIHDGAGTLDAVLLRDYQGVDGYFLSTDGVVTTG
jgi:hypothetical protein